LSRFELNYHSKLGVTYTPKFPSEACLEQNRRLRCWLGPASHSMRIIPNDIVSQIQKPRGLPFASSKRLDSRRDKVREAFGLPSLGSQPIPWSRSIRRYCRTIAPMGLTASNSCIEPDRFPGSVVRREDLYTDSRSVNPRLDHRPTPVLAGQGFREVGGGGGWVCVSEGSWFRMCAFRCAFSYLGPGKCVG